MLSVRLEKQLRDCKLSLEVTVHPGEILVFMGRNGAGKSTTLNLISGLVQPDAGCIRLNGRTVYDSDRGIDIPVEERRIGYVFQNPAVFPHLTVKENIAYGLQAQRMDRFSVDETAERWLGRMAIRDIGRVRAGSLSGGQRQRVALARALAPMPALLMLDEPFTALDTRSLYSIKEYIRRCVIETQIPCILVTHRIADAADLGNHICLLDKGRIACQGDAEQVREAYECECPDRSPGGRCGCG